VASRHPLAAELPGAVPPPIRKALLESPEVLGRKIHAWTGLRHREHRLLEHGEQSSTASMPNQQLVGLCATRWLGVGLGRLGRRQFNDAVR